MTIVELLRLHRRPLADAGEPGGDVGIGRIERLADSAAEIDPAVEQHIRQRETAAAEIVPARHLTVEPFKAVRRDHLEAGGSFWRAGRPVLEELQGHAEAITVGQW